MFIINELIITPRLTSPPFLLHSLHRRIQPVSQVRNLSGTSLLLLLPGLFSVIPIYLSFLILFIHLIGFLISSLISLPVILSPPNCKPVSDVPLLRTFSISSWLEDTNHSSSQGTGHPSSSGSWLQSSHSS